jgi:hypothetical protein
MSDIVTKLTPDGHLILPKLKCPRSIRGQARVNYLRERNEQREAALVDRVVAMAKQKGTLDNIIEKQKPDYNNSLSAERIG